MSFLQGHHRGVNDRRGSGGDDGLVSLDSIQGMDVDESGGIGFGLKSETPYDQSFRVFTSQRSEEPYNKTVQGFRDHSQGETDGSGFSNVLRSTEAAFQKLASISDRTRLKLKRESPKSKVEDINKTPLRGSNFLSTTGEFVKSEILDDNTQPGRKFRVFVAPSEEDELKNICFKAIGEGISVCIKTSCADSHRGGKSRILPNQAFIMKSRTRVFKDPTAMFNLLDKNIYNEWAKSKKTLNEWTELFDAINKTVSDNLVHRDSPIDDLDIEVTKAKTQQNLARKTPAKRKKLIFKEDEGIAIHSSSAQILDRLMEKVQEDPNNLLQILQTAFTHSDTKLKLMSGKIDVLQDYSSKQEEEHRDLSLACDSKFDNLRMSIGTKPTLLSEEFEAPNLWSAIAQLGEQMIVVQNNFNVIKSLQDKSDKLKALLSDLQATVRKNIQQSEHNCHTRINVLETTIHNIVQYLVKDINELKSRPSTFNKVPATPGVDVSDELQHLKQDLRELSSEVADVKMSNSNNVIKFNKLGFKSLHDAGAWYLTNSPGDHFGLIVDFHTLMENVYNNGPELMS